MEPYLAMFTGIKLFQIITVLRGIVVLSSQSGWEALLCCLVGQEVDALGC
jgi:hypothetical protein